jgi:phosphate transport system permease protein
MKFSSIYIKRQTLNFLGLGISVLATLFGLFFLFWILYILISHGATALNLDVFTQDVPAPGADGGGLRNAIVGSLLTSFFGMLIGTPIGILAGTYMSEFGSRSKVVSVIRFINDILLSAPSIVLGVFVYIVFVVPLGNFSGWAGSVALSLIVIPVVVRTTDDMLSLVPVYLREAAAALGAPRWKVTISIVYRAAISGLVTGVLLALARIVGETAPLLFTALGNQFYNHNMNEPMSALPLIIFHFAMSPYEHWQELAWTGSLLITLFVLILNILARTFSRPSNKRD